MARKGKEIDRFGRLVWNEKGAPKIDRMLYSGCEIVKDVQCCQHITITTIWNHLSHHQSLISISFIPLSPVTYSVTQAATSQIYANNSSFLSTANGTAIHKYIQIQEYSQHSQ